MPPVCSNCGSSAGKLKACSCKLVRYCGKACQLEDWKKDGGHKGACQAARQASSEPPPVLVPAMEFYDGLSRETREKFWGTLVVSSSESLFKCDTEITPEEQSVSQHAVETIFHSTLNGLLLPQGGCKFLLEWGALVENEPMFKLLVMNGDWPSEGVLAVAARRFKDLGLVGEPPREGLPPTTSSISPSEFAVVKFLGFSISLATELLEKHSVAPQFPLENICEKYTASQDQARDEGNSAFKMGDTKLAIDLYRKAWSKARRDPRVPLNLALAFTKDGSLVAAVNCCLKALLFLPVTVHPFYDPRTGSATWVPSPDFHSDLACKGFARIAKALAEISRGSSGTKKSAAAAAALRAARASSRCVRSSVYQKLALDLIAETRTEDEFPLFQNQPLVLRCTNDAAFERHIVGNTDARLVGYEIDLEDRRRYNDQQPCQLGFFGCGDVRNLMFTLWGLVRVKLSAAAGIKLGADPIYSLKAAQEYTQKFKTLEDHPLPVEVHINDVNVSVLARDIVLLVIASRHQVGGDGLLDTPLLFFAAQCHLVLYGCQRRAMDLILRQLVSASESLASFQKAYPWLELHDDHGDGVVGEDGEIFLQELRWTWIRWMSTRRISSDVLATHCEVAKKNLAQQISGLQHPEHPTQSSISADVESRIYFAHHGMLPLTPSIRAKLTDKGVNFELEAEEREGNFRFVNPLLTCPHAGTIQTEIGPESPYRDVFLRRDPAPEDAGNSAALALAMKRYGQMRRLIDASRRDDRETCEAAHASDGGVLSLIMPTMGDWLEIFAGGVCFEEQPLDIHKIHVWPGDCIDLCARSRLVQSNGQPLAFDALHASNVVDYVGLIPLIGCLRPLMRHGDGFASSLELEVMMGYARSFEDLVARDHGPRFKPADLEKLLAVKCYSDDGVNGAQFIKFKPVSPNGASSAFDCRDLFGSLLEFTVGPSRRPFPDGGNLFKGLCTGRGIQCITVHAVVSLLLLHSSRQTEKRIKAAAAAAEALDTHLEGHTGSPAAKLHRLALFISFAMLQRGPGPFGTRLLTSHPPINAMALRRFRALVKPLKDKLWEWECNIVAMVATPEVAAGLKRQCPTGGDALLAALYAKTPGNVQILDSLRYDVTSRLLDIVLPGDISAFLPTIGGLVVVLLDVRAWEFVSEPIDLPLYPEKLACGVGHHPTC